MSLFYQKQSFKKYYLMTNIILLLCALFGLVGLIYFVSTSESLVNSNANGMNFSETSTVEKMDPDIREIDLSGKNITTVLPDLFIKKKKLQTLFIGNNPLVILPDQTWLNHPSIIYLDITDSNLGALDPVAFSELKGLKFVNMTGNPGCVETRKRAYDSNVSYSINCGSDYNTVDNSNVVNVFEISQLVEKMDPGIQKIDLRGKNITILPSDIFMKKKELKVLLIGNNPLVIPLHRMWIHHSSIDYLDISYSNLKALNPNIAFQGLKELRLVNATGNPGCFETRKISREFNTKYKIICDPEFNPLNNIKATDFSEISLMVVKMDPNIREINLVGKNITIIPRDIFIKKEKLRTLLIGSNPLDIPSDKIWINHPNITYLDISDSNLEALNPIVFEGLQRLRFVNMAGNPGCVVTQERAWESNVSFRIKCNSEFNHFHNLNRTDVLNISLIVDEMDPNIRKINLKGKNITIIPRDIFIKKDKLRTLLIGANPLDIPSDKIWINHSNITYLDISDSNLEALNPIVFEGLQRLRFVNMAGNPGCVVTHERACESNVSFRIKCI